MIKECVVCGKLFETAIYNKVTCSHECQKVRNRMLNKGYENGLNYRVNIVDLKIYQVLEIMRLEKITIGQYLDNRDFYVARYMLNH